MRTSPGQGERASRQKMKKEGQVEAPAGFCKNLYYWGGGSNKGTRKNSRKKM